MVVGAGGYGLYNGTALEADECWVGGCCGDAVDVAMAEGAAAVVALRWVCGEIVGGIRMGAEG